MNIDNETETHTNYAKSRLADEYGVEQIDHMTIHCNFSNPDSYDTYVEDFFTSGTYDSSSPITKDEKWRIKGEVNMKSYKEKKRAHNWPNYMLGCTPIAGSFFAVLPSNPEKVIFPAMMAFFLECMQRRAKDKKE